MASGDKIVGMGITLYQRQVGVLEAMENEMGGSVGRSAVLRRIIDEYIALEPIRKVLQACEMEMITHAEALDRLSVLIERGGNGA